MDSLIKGYLYRHIRKDTNEVFYIGISCNENYKRAYSKLRRNKFWINITSKTEYEVEIMLESEDYNFLIKKEIEFIKLYGRKDLKEGTLVNLTYGGEGFIGYKYTDEDRKKMSESRKGKGGLKGEKHPMYGRRGVLSPCYGIPVSEEAKRKSSESQKGEKHHYYGKKRDESFCIKISEALKGRKYPELSKKFKGEGNPFFGKKHSDKTLEKRSKKVIDTSTNIIYKSMFDASEKLKINYVTLKYWLRESKFTKTSLRYYKED